jgi:hypothetical protein
VIAAANGLQQGRRSMPLLHCPDIVQIWQDNRKLPSNPVVHATRHAKCTGRFTAFHFL